MDVAKRDAASNSQNAKEKTLQTLEGFFYFLQKPVLDIGSKPRDSITQYWKNIFPFERARYTLMARIFQSVS